jgi:hypothetical protein
VEEIIYLGILPHSQRVLFLAFSESEQDENLNRPLDMNMNGRGIGQNNRGFFVYLHSNA